MKLVGYLRVSTDKQAEHGLGLAVQEKAVRAWAKANGHRLVDVLRDEGISGSNGLGTRVALGSALDLVRTKKAAGIVVYRLDRLARDLVLQESLLAEVWRLGADVLSTAAGESDLKNDPQDPSRKLIRQVLGAVAEYERDMIRLRLSSGRALKAERGGYAYGSPGFGYRAEGGELVRDEQEWVAVERIRELRKAGRSYREIAAALDSEGLNPRKADSWSALSVRAVAQREAR